VDTVVADVDPGGNAVARRDADVRSGVRPTDADLGVVGALAVTASSVECGPVEALMPRPVTLFSLSA